ncbi:MAG TPA: hypothetical protein VFE53_12620 [Mucilaginibacter sp.]|jgi:hypothetical protein|nr:hypothetical protein [Mucilaginibacter sp.]
MEKLFVVLMVMLLSKSSITNTPATDAMLLQIDFQDFFVNDKADLKINNVLILKDVVLSSDRSTGFTGIIVVINKLNENTAQVHYKSVNVDVELRDSIKVDIFLNGVENVFIVDGGKGKYVGFSKKDANQLYFMQRATHFVYD